MLKLSILEEELSICRVEKNQNVVNYIVNSNFFSVIKTKAYLSVVCETRFAKDALFVESGWKGISIENKAGDLLSINEGLLEIVCILKELKIRMVILSTYDEEHILVKKDKLEVIIDNLEKIGCTIV